MLIHISLFVLLGSRDMAQPSVWPPTLLISAALFDASKPSRRFVIPIENKPSAVTVAMPRKRADCVGGEQAQTDKHGDGCPYT